MTRSILCGLLALVSVGAMGLVPLACQSGGVGDPCTPEEEYEATFSGLNQNDYLWKTLPSYGLLLRQYYGTGHVSLDNYISMISGQAPTPDTENDCIRGLTGSVGHYNDVAQSGTTADGQVIANAGCIYAATVQSLPDQLTA